ncbi:MAG: transglutaminase domain-containing protein [Luteolibacter sp.]
MRNGARWKRALPGTFALLMLLAGNAFGGGYYDPSTFDRQKAYDFLETVEQSVGSEAYEKLRPEYGMHLALRLGPIDLYSMTPGVFAEHIRLTQEVEKRFYTKRPLDEEQVKQYLLPLRIRYEHTSKPQWRSVLSKQFSPLIEKTKTTDEAVGVIAGWMRKNLKLLGSPTAYRIPMRGDLAPLAVLQGKEGSEIDQAIFGVAALRTVGVACRLAWAPILRGEIGGKFWVEYLDEDHAWKVWVPSFGEAGDHRALLKKRFGGKMIVVLTHPDEPVQITASYVDTVEIRMAESFSNQPMTLLALGKEGLIPAFGLEENRLDESTVFHAGRGPVFVAVSIGKLDKTLLRLDPAPDARLIEIALQDGRAVIVPKAPASLSPQPQSSPNPP